MKIILLKKLNGVGDEYEIKEVKDGYARNYLIPKNLAIPLNERNLKWLEELNKKKQQKIKIETKRTMEIFHSLNDKEITIKVKAGENGKIFGSVTKEKIIEKIAEETKIELDKYNILIDEPLKSLGVHVVPIKLNSEFLKDEEIPTIKIKLKIVQA